jgi:hypothetical protein
MHTKIRPVGNADNLIAKDEGAVHYGEGHPIDDRDAEDEAIRMVMVVMMMVVIW